jgi:hypothetical protein
MVGTTGEVKKQEPPGRHDVRRTRWQPPAHPVDTKAAISYRGAKKVKGRKKR